MKNTDILLISYSNPQQEEYIEKLKTELFTFAEVQGETHGKSNLPTQREEYNAYVFNKICVSVQESIHYNQQTNQPVSGMVMVNKIRQDAAGDKSEIRAKVADQNLLLAPLEGEKKRMQRLLQGKWPKHIEIIVAIVFGVIEGLFAYTAFHGAGYPNSTSFIFGIGIAIILSCAIHVAAPWIRKAKTINVRRLRHTLTLIIGGCVAFGLGYIRATLYNSGISLNPHVSVVHSETSYVASGFIAVFSFLSFLVSLAIALKYWRTDEEKKLWKAYKLKCREVSEAGKKIQDLLTAEKSIEVDEKEKTQTAYEKYEYAIGFENRCISIAYQAQQMYIDKNLRYRNDGVIPTFFSAPPQFSFTKFFQNVKS